MNKKRTLCISIVSIIITLPNIYSSATSPSQTAQALSEPEQTSLLAHLYTMPGLGGIDIHQEFRNQQEEILKAIEGFVPTDHINTTVEADNAEPITENNTMERHE